MKKLPKRLTEGRFSAYFGSHFGIALDDTAKQSLHQSALSGSFWFAWAFGCYLTIYFQSIGFSASQMGLINALASTVSIVAASFWGSLSDKIGSVKKVEIILLSATALLYSLVPALGRLVSPVILPFFFYMPIVNFFRGAVSTYNENLIVRNANELRLHYGRIRSIGSLLFTVGSVLISLLLPKVGVENTFWLSGVLMIVPIVLTATSRDPSSTPKRRDKREKLNYKGLFGNRSYVAFLGFAAIFYTAVSFEGSFIPYFMADKGIASERYGILLAYRALLEIPFLLMMTFLRKRFSLQKLILFTAILMGVECLGFGLIVRSFPLMIVFATFFGLGNGLFIFSSLNYLYEIAPDNMKASAQAFFASTSAVAGILGNVLGGILYDALGSSVFYLLAAGLYGLSALIFALFTRQKTEQKTA